MTSWDCEQLGGTSLPEGSTCYPYPCPTPWACCFDDGSCEILLRLDCWAIGGLFMGFDVDCDPNPCVMADVPEGTSEAREEVTWGRIKSRYRN